MKVALIGDSHTQALGPRLKAALAQAGGVKQKYKARKR